MKGHGDCRRIEAEIKVILESSMEVSDEIRASLARYACVLASGYLEAAMRELVASYTRKRGSETLHRYIESTLGLFQNPNTEKILRLVGRFDPKCRRDLELSVEGQLKDSVDSIYSNRNSIAHGRLTGISLARVRTYYADARTVVKEAETVLTAERSGG